MVNKLILLNIATVVSSFFVWHSSIVALKLKFLKSFLKCLIYSLIQVLCLNNNRIESIFPRHKWGKQKSNQANGDFEDSHEGDMDFGTCGILLKLEVLHLG